MIVQPDVADMVQKMLIPTTWYGIPIRAGIIYGFILLAMRLSGKRQMGQLTPFDLVLLLLISNAVQNAMTGPDVSLLGGVLAALTLIGCNWLTSITVMRWHWFKIWVEGTPTLLVHKGEIIWSHLKKEGIGGDELYQALREHGVLQPKEVFLAVLELDGSISVVKNADVDPAVVCSPTDPTVCE